MKWWHRLKSLFLGSAATKPPPEPVPALPVGHRAMYPMKVRYDALVAAANQPVGVKRAQAFAALFPIPEPPPGVPDGAAIKQAMDDAMSPLYGFAAVGSFGEGIGFLGYPFLAELTQRAEYRMISEIRAKEMTRKWIELEYAGEDEDAADRLQDLTEWFDKHKVREHFRKAAEHDGFFGRAQIFIDMGQSEGPELRTKLILKPQKISKGKFKGLRVVEPMWTYPNAYNAANPLRPDYFRPQSWFVQGQLVHSSRLLTMVSREMPDLLKPAYAFGGLSLTQMAMPYVDNWLRTRQSVSDLLHSFSMVVLATDMGQVLEGQAGDDLFNRVDLFSLTRDNRGTFVINKESEELTNLAVPLGTLDKLQAQAQEQMASVSQTPLVKLLGVTPSGLNASSDGEIRVYYDGINSLQEHLFRDPLTTVLKIAQLDLWGEIDDAITFKFVPLWQLDDAAEASVRKTDADTDAVYVEAGVLDPLEVRKALAADPHSRYAGLDVEDVPEPPEMEGEPDDSGDPAKSAEPKGEERSGV